MLETTRKILCQQLEMLAEESKKCQEKNETQLLIELTKAMSELAKYC